LFLFGLIIFRVNVSISESQSSQLFDVNLKYGWNMVSFPFTDAKIEYLQSNCYFLYPYAFYLNSSTKKYEKFSLKTDTNLGGIGLFIFTYDDCTLKISGSNKFRPSEIELKKGLNHIAIPYNGIDLGYLSGCRINEVRYLNSTDGNLYKWESYWGTPIIYSKYNITTKKWEKIGEFKSFPLPTGINILIDVSDNCKLNFGASQSSSSQATTTSTSSTSTTTTTQSGGGGGGGRRLPT